MDILSSAVARIVKTLYGQPYIRGRIWTFSLQVEKFFRIHICFFFTIFFFFFVLDGSRRGRIGADAHPGLGRDNSALASRFDAPAASSMKG